MRSKNRLKPTAERPATTALPIGRPPDDGWVDLVADRVSEVLTDEALDLELVVFYDKVTETLHAVGYDGAPARFFASLPAPSDSPRSRGTPMSQNDTNQPEQTSPETNEKVGA